MRRDRLLLIEIIDATARLVALTAGRSVEDIDAVRAIDVPDANG